MRLHKKKREKARKEATEKKGRKKYDETTGGVLEEAEGPVVCAPPREEQRSHPDESEVGTNGRMKGMWKSV